MNRVMAVVAAVTVALLASNHALAEVQTGSSSSSIVISHIQAGASGDHTQEMIAVYNNSSEPVDITGWCVANKSSLADIQAGSITKPLGCFIGAEPNERMLLPSSAYALAVSESFMAAHPETIDRTYDMVFVKSVTITASSDTISLYDDSLSLIDTVSWSSSLDAGKVFQRKVATAPTLLDTGSFTDFEKITGPIIPLSGITYIRVIQDLCGNIDGIQESIPSDYGYDEAGNCELLSLDACNNIDAVQVETPDGLLMGDDGGCYADVCSNIVGLQQHVPIGFSIENDICSALESRILRLNEILANTIGSDVGREFIELYNPNESPVHLNGYVLSVGKTLENDYLLGTENETIPGYGFLVLYDHEVGFTLLNTSSRIQLRAPSGVVVSEVEYVEPKEDESWAWLEDSWRYTDKLTPNGPNEPMSEYKEEVAAVTTALQPCPSGKYRHPVTNRCRNIDSDAAILASCDADEYRNPETNRCRKVAGLVSALTPCNEGYERNPETNRCRKVSSSAKTLSACQSGYERNPATNRCRKISPVTSASTPASAVNTASAGSVLTNALIVTTGAGAVAYGLYEWRHEFVRGARRLVQMISGK